MAKRLADCRVAIVGLGLMGASLAMDLTRNQLCREVRGIARRTETVLDAFFAGAVDLATNDLATGVLGADIVIMATPVRTIVDLLDEIGCILLSRSHELGKQPGLIRQFLDDNVLPKQLPVHLPDDFRVFCLALNALKVWVSAEQAATDRYLLGGTVREECRETATTCIVTGEPLMSERVQLHHPVRDGRPPIPLSQKGHSLIENQTGRKSKARKGSRR